MKKKMSDGRETLRLGTRGSVLAVCQTEWVAAELRRLSPGLSVELVRIRTSGDRIQGSPLAEIGGKGLFVKEIEEALRDGRIDAGVHSMKDLPVNLAPGLAIVAVPPREDARDALVARTSGGLRGLARGARVGTGSLRRRAFLRNARPDLEVVAMRGNVDTRLRKWHAGEIDALILARAGLRRLELEIAEAHDLSTEEMLPAIGQGALAVEAQPESRWRDLLARLDDRQAAAATAAERAFLAAMGGDCTTPVAAFATVDRAALYLAAAVGDPQGLRLVRGARSGDADEAAAVGIALAEELLARGGREILQELRR
jgi:hydroxymethylbilane synthase